MAKPLLDFKKASRCKYFTNEYVTTVEKMAVNSAFLFGFDGSRDCRNFCTKVFNIIDGIAVEQSLARDIGYQPLLPESAHMIRTIAGVSLSINDG